MKIGRVFYFDKREEEIYAELLEKVRCMVEGARYLEKSILELRGEQHDQDVSKAIEFEKKCDVQTENLMERILKIKHSRSRGDLLLLNQSLEKVAKSIEAASHRVKMSRGIRLPDYLNDGLQKMATAMVETIEALVAVLDHMPYLSDEVIEHLHEVHQREEKMDELRRKSCSEFVDSGEELSLQKFYVWQEVVAKMESTADNCDEAAEIIGRIIAARD